MEVKAGDCCCGEVAGSWSDLLFVAKPGMEQREFRIISPPRSHDPQL